MKVLARLVVIVALTVPACVHSEARGQAAVSATWTRIMRVQEAISEFRLARGRLPASLDEICPLQQQCQYMPVSSGRGGIRDEWGRPLLYSTIDGEFELRSLGVDAMDQTVDDLIFRPSAVQRLIENSIGCYDINLAWWKDFPGGQLVLDSIRTSLHGMRVQPTVQSRIASWSVRLPDSISVEWAEEHSIAHLGFRVTGDSLVGTARIPGHSQRSVIARRAVCR